MKSACLKQLMEDQTFPMESLRAAKKVRSSTPLIHTSPFVGAGDSQQHLR